MLTQKTILRIAIAVALSAAMIFGYFLVYPSADASIAAPNPLFVWDKLPSNGSAADVAMAAFYAAKDIKAQDEAVDRLQKISQLASSGYVDATRQVASTLGRLKSRLNPFFKRSRDPFEALLLTLNQRQRLALRRILARQTTYEQSKDQDQQ